MTLNSSPNFATRDTLPLPLVQLTAGLGRVYRAQLQRSCETVTFSQCVLCLDTGFTQDEEDLSTGIAICRFCPRRAGFEGGRYRLIKQIGRGTFCQVFLVQDRYWPGKVKVVKLLKPGLDNLAMNELWWWNFTHWRDDEQTRFLRKGGQIGILLEYLQPLPESLRLSCTLLTELLSNLRRLTVDISLTLLRLHEAPEEPVLHADVKLDNILWCERRENYQLIDFGNCVPRGKWVDYEQLYELQSWPYRAPEVMVGVSPLEVTADIWSLGVVLIQLLARSLPFSANNREEILGEMVEVLGPLPDYFSRGKYFTSELPTQSSFGIEGQDDGFWRRWRKSNLARLCNVADAEVMDLLAGMLEIDPKRRFTARNILSHPWVRPLVPFPPVEQAAINGYN